MADYRAKRAPNTQDQDKRGPWRTIALIGVVLGLVISVLFVAGFWNAKAKEPRALPDMNVRVVGDPLPGIMIEPKNELIGTMRIPVDVPAREASPGTGAAERSMQPGNLHPSDLP